MQRRVALLGTLLACAAALAAVAVRADDKEVTIARTHKAGETTRYNMKATFTVGGMEGTLTAVTAVTTKEVRKNGDVVTVTTMESAHMSAGGNEQDLPQQEPVTTVFGKQGKLVEMKTDENTMTPFSPEVQRLMAQLGDVLFPDKPLKPGATWKIEVDNPVVKGRKAVVNGTYIGTEKVGDLECWKVKQVADADTDTQGGKMTTEATFWLSPTNGQIVKEESTSKNIPTNFGTMSMTSTTTRAKA